MPASAALLVLAGVLIAGCSRSTGLRERIPRLSLDLTALPPTGNRDTPISVIGQVANAGPGSVFHGNRCATQGFEWSAWLGDTALVYLDLPGSLSTCRDTTAELFEGQSVDGGVLFDGTLFTAQGDPYDAPPGEYSVRAAWKYWTRASGTDSTRLRARILIHWESVLAKRSPPATTRSPKPIRPGRPDRDGPATAVGRGGAARRSVADRVRVPPAKPLLQMGLPSLVAPLPAAPG